MRQLLKITFALVLAPVLIASTAFGQNTVDIDQVSSTASWTQTLGNGSNTIAGITGGSADPAVSNTFNQTPGSELRALQTVNGGGAANELFGEQLGGGGHLMDTKQHGYFGQKATIYQDGGGTMHEAQLRQFTGPNGTSGNTANITQTNNAGDLVKGPRFAAENRLGFVNTNSRRAPQIGSGNYLGLGQRGGANTLYFEQEGNGNTINLTQKTGGGSYAEISQHGDNNIVARDKNGSGRLSSWDSELFIRQDGSNNVVYGDQKAPGSSATINQSNGSVAQSQQIP
jgi:hypothetical protein